MKTLTVALPAEYADWLEARVAAGEYTTLDEAVLAAVDWLKSESDGHEPGEIDEHLDRLVQEGIDSLKHGESMDGEEFMAAWLAESEHPALEEVAK